ncbi:hypothetical protein Q1695_011735 [Nippostrongylus brasiliensis]|nr:hypothetical protein Q1695_011735 [Nippostrongylus brasiliensis]
MGDDVGILGSGDRRSGLSRLNTIQNALFTRPPNNFDKTGSSGRYTQLMANFVPVEQRPELIVYQYHVEFEPIIESKHFRHSVLKQKSIVDIIGPYFIFDGMILYIADHKDFSGTYDGHHPVTEAPVVVTLKTSVRFTHNDAQTISCFNIIVRSCLDSIGLRRFGRHHYDEKQRVKLRDYHMEVWPGFETAIRQYEDQLMLCTENRFKLIRTDSVWEVMRYEMNRVRGDMNKFYSAMEDVLVGQTVFARYNNKMYRILEIRYDMSPESRFTLANGNDTSLRDYFEAQYNLTIRASDQPVLVSEGRVRQPGDSPQRIYLLPELCFPTGLTDTMRKDFRHMKELSQHTRLDPERRRRSTEALLIKVHNSDKCCALLEKWGICLDRRLVSFRSRELEPEKLYGTSPNPYVGIRAEWAKANKTFGNYRHRNLTNWVVIVPDFQDGERLSRFFIEEVTMIGAVMSMNVGIPILQTTRDITPKAYKEAITTAISRAGRQPIHMLVLILADDSKTRYDHLKSWMCTETNIPSQCVKLSTLRGRPQDGGRSRNFGSIVLKILLQMNCKMGGALWKVQIPLKKTMIVGYDLYHDSTLRGKTIGACVSTTDSEFTEFFSQTRPHENPTELGNNLEFFIRRALKKYYDKNGNQLPERIFLYRDGVGDGQIPQVKDQEVTLVQQACREVCKAARAPHQILLAFIIVTKKVNMRIFKGTPESVLTNPSPGTVVDTVVTRPERYDFYLVPQYVSQGTVTPVCYNVIFDNTNLSPDQHQKLAFKLCHLYYNWQGTVRVPAPCQYAHKLAFMVAQSIHKQASEELSDTLFFL